MLDALKKHESTTGALNGLSAKVLRQHFLHSLTEMQVRKTLERLRRHGKVLAVGTRQDRKYCTKGKAVKVSKAEPELTWLVNCAYEFFRSSKPTGTWFDVVTVAGGIIVPPGRVMTPELVREACDQLVAKGRLRSSEGLYSAPMPVGEAPVVAHPRPNWVTVNLVEDFAKKCNDALDPDGHNEGLPPVMLPARIAQQRANLETANRQLSEERKKRHEAEQTLANEKAVWGFHEQELLEDCTRKGTELLHARARGDALESQLDAHEAKLSALDACYRGLFGERKP